MRSFFSLQAIRVDKVSFIPTNQSCSSPLTFIVSFVIVRARGNRLQLFVDSRPLRILFERSRLPLQPRMARFLPGGSFLDGLVEGTPLSSPTSSSSLCEASLTFPSLSFSLLLPLQTLSKLMDQYCNTIEEMFLSEMFPREPVDPLVPKENAWIVKAKLTLQGEKKIEPFNFIPAVRAFPFLLLRFFVRLTIFALPYSPASSSTTSRRRGTNSIGCTRRWE